MIKTEDLYTLFKKHPKITTDTRKEVNDTLFFALKGENFDANSFVLRALEKGAAYVIADSKELPYHNQIIQVDNTLDCLQKLAAYHRKQLNIPIIAITGSNGKTTSKELIHTVLKTKMNSFSTPGNLNNHIGVPLSLLQINEQHEVAVLEIGANHIGENKFLTEIIQPTHGITTNIGKDHLGEFGGIEGVIEAYKEFTDYFVNHYDKTFFLNNDDDMVKKLANKTTHLSFGLSKNNKPTLQGEILFDSVYLNMKVEANESFKIKTQLFGNYNAYNVLAAACIGLYFNITISEIQKAIEAYKPTNNRSQIVKWQTNHIIFDAYNANPSSMELVINDFNKLNKQNKTIVLADMHELGKYSEAEHQHIVKQLKSTSFSRIILVGKTFGKYKNEINCIHFENSTLLKNWFANQKFNNHYLLLKGSRSERLERMFEDLL